MRLLALTNSMDTTSGWGMYAFSLVKTLREQGVIVTVLSSDKTSEGPRLPDVHDGIRSWIVGAWHFALWLRQHQSSFDGVHIMVEPYARYARLFRLPLLLTIHGTYVDPAAHGHWWARILFKDALRRATRIVCVSQFTARRLPEHLQEKSIVIHNGVDASLLTEPIIAPKRVVHPLILAVGAIKPRKGFDLLIKGFARFVAKNTTASLVIIGAGLDKAEAARLERLVKALKLENQVTFTGQISRAELLGWYKVCDVFALTPLEKGGFEGFGLVYLEANLFGKPCLGSRDSGAGEAIEEGETGYLVDPLEAEEIAEGLEKCLQMSCEKMIPATLKRTWKYRGLDYLAVYRSIMMDKE